MLDLDAVQARAEAATPGPWIATTTTDDQWFVHSPKLDAEVVVHDGDYTVDFNGTERTSEFIAHARTDIPALLVALRVAQEVVEEARGHQDALSCDCLRNEIAAYDRLTGEVR